MHVYMCVLAFLKEDIRTCIWDLLMCSQRITSGVQLSRLSVDYNPQCVRVYVTPIEQTALSNSRWIIHCNISVIINFLGKICKKKQRCIFWIALMKKTLSFKFRSISLWCEAGYYWSFGGYLALNFPYVELA